MARRCTLLAAIIVILVSRVASAQTTAGIGTTIVFPVTAQTGSFASEVTVFNPGPSALTAHVTFFEANNSSTPGTKVCTDASVPANRSLQFSIGAQCPLAAGSHFGLLVLADSANPQTNSFYGYTRVQNPLGIGFSVEGFPLQNFSNQVSHATGLKRQAASPTFQTNCFVGSLEQPVSYELKLFNDATGAQIGNTLTGSLNAFEQFRYLDVFGPNGVNAPAGDQFNVRAQFTQTSGGTANLIGFCTVQDNTSFGADFRIAKSYGSPSNSFFAQGGNTFGTTAKLGTLDNQPLEIYVNNQRAMRYAPNATTANLVGGSPSNSVNATSSGQTIGGGGFDGPTCSVNTVSRPCLNQTSNDFATVGGGVANGASGDSATVAGGAVNAASGVLSTVAGGGGNIASGTSSFVAGGQVNVAGGFASFAAGNGNIASGSASAVVGGEQNAASAPHTFAAGFRAKATTTGSFIWADSQNFDFGPSVNNFFGVRATGGVGLTVGINPSTGAVTEFCNLLPAVTPSWACTSDRDVKENFIPVNGKDLLQRLVAMPLFSWNMKNGDPAIRSLGPTAQDFYDAFGLGKNDKTIASLNLEGVALGAIQGLSQVVREKDAQIEAQQHRIVELEERIARIESLRDEVAALKAAIAAFAGKPKITNTGAPQ